MLRIANKRFLFACRTHCVPSIFPWYLFARLDRCTVSTVSNVVKMTLRCRQMVVRNVIISDVAKHSPRCFVCLTPCMFHRYFIKYGEKQATLKDKKHREAVHFLAFAAAGVFGRTGAGGRDHRVLTWVLCELAAILKSAFDVRPKTWAHAKSVCRRMSRWIENDFQTLFGPSHTTKLHRAVSHLLDEFILRGNLQDGNTGVNEALHKFVKQAFALTNKSRDKAALQMVLTEQIDSLVRRSR